MNKAREIIREVLSESEHPALLLSGGKDSVLLLDLIREIKNISVIWFSLRRNLFIEKLILDLDLDVWSWKPTDVYLVPNESGISLIREQSFGHSALPVVSDVEDGEGCIFDFPQERTSALFPHFDALFLGYKDSDEEWILGGRGFCPADGWMLGKAKVYSPLRHLTDAQVWQAIRELNIPYDVERYDRDGLDPDTVYACTNCLRGKKAYCPKVKRLIKPHRWKPEESLGAFRERFGFRAA